MQHLCRGHFIGFVKSHFQNYLLSPTPDGYGDVPRNTQAGLAVNQNTHVDTALACLNMGEL